MQVNDAVIETDEILIGIQLQGKVLFVEESNTLFHHSIFEARGIEALLNLGHFLHPCFFKAAFVISQIGKAITNLRTCIGNHLCHFRCHFVSKIDALWQSFPTISSEFKPFDFL